MIAKQYRINSQTCKLSILLTVVFIIIACSHAIASAPISHENRVALVIGNASYKFDPLLNPANDAKAMSRTLGKLGFKVLHYEDMTLREMQRALDTFSKDLKRDNSVGLFYYAGHALQVEDRNYLLPVEADITTQNDIKTQALQLDNVLGEMERAGNEVNIIVLDACRNNPFLERIASASPGSSRSLDRGITRQQKSLGLAPAKGSAGMYIAYATAPNMVAADGTDRNGLYTKHLLRYISEKGLSLEQVFKKVRLEVAEESGGQQIPWERSSLLKEFYFIPNLETKSAVSVRDMIIDARRAVESGKYGVAYRKLKVADKMATEEMDVNDIRELKSEIKTKLGSD